MTQHYLSPNALVQFSITDGAQILGLVRPGIPCVGCSQGGTAGGRVWGVRPQSLTERGMASGAAAKAVGGLSGGL